MKTKHSFCAAVLGTAVALLSPGAARASLWNFDFTPAFGTDNNVLQRYTGTLDVDQNVVVGISGSATIYAGDSTPGAAIWTPASPITSSSSIATLLGANDFQGNDNSFSGTAPYLDVAGVSFTTADGFYINLFANRSGTGQALRCTDLDCSSATLTVGDFTASLASDAAATVPEPDSLALVGASLVGLGVVRRRKAAVSPHRRLALGPV